MAIYKWLGHASFALEGAEKTIYIDPYQLSGDLPKADIICVTHSHHDHFSMEDIVKIAKPETVVVATSDCVGLANEVVSLRSGESTQIDQVTIEAVAAYNIGKQFHPKERGWVGYIITFEGTRYYHSGDTDLIPEMEEIETDVAFLPVGGKYTMGAREAAVAANIIQPKLAIPMHWGTIIGGKSDAEVFRDNCDVMVEILTPEKG